MAGLSQYLVILGVGGCCLFLLFRLTVLQSIWSSCKSHPYIFTAVGLVFITLTWPSGVQTAFDRGDDLGLNRTVRVVVFGGLFLGMAYVVLRQSSLPKRSALYLFIGYVFFCTLSAVYSPNPFESIWKSFELLVLALIGLLVHFQVKKRSMRPQAVLDLITFFLVLATVNALVGIVLYPDAALAFGREGPSATAQSLGGIFPKVNANSLGQYGAMLVVVAFVRAFILREIRTGWILLLCVCLASLLLAYSRTSIIACAVTIFTLGLFNGSSRVALVVTVGCLGGVVYAPQLFEYMARGQDEYVFASLSGRTYMWATGYEAFLQRPFFGHGFYSGHKALDIDIGQELSSLDSTYIDALVDVGLLGSAFLFGFVFRCLAIAKDGLLLGRVQDRAWNSIFFGFISIMFIRSLTGPSFQALHLNLLFLLLMVAAWEGRHARRGQYESYE